MGESAAAPTNRVDINAAVRQNLGITFATVESRSIARTLRIPGRFELLPTAHRQYRAAASGTVELLVEQFQTVVPGTPLYRLDSPSWREMQRDIADAEAAVTLAQAGADSIGPLLAAHEEHHAEIQKAVDVWTARVATLEQLRADGVGGGEGLSQARAAMAASRSEMAETQEKEAELLARRSETAARLESAVARRAFLYEAAATLAGMSVADLQSPSPGEPSVPRWRTTGAIEVRAVTGGIVDTVAVDSGGLVDQHAAVVSTVQPDRLRFRAVALQSDLPRIADGQNAIVIAAQPTGSSNMPALSGTVVLAPTADAERRTIDVVLVPDADEAAPLPAWARAGVTAYLEIVTVGPITAPGGSAGDELAIPLRCVARDGTSAIIFRRDPADPNKAIRMEADLGIDDGRWVVIKSGVAEGNEIVLDGVYQLMVATSGNITKGGHFHPDGTFHEGED